MSQVDEAHNKYVNDPRIPCKYGTKCYQKNPVHHQKYKHPDRKGSQNNKHVTKRFKAETKGKIKKITTQDSDSESSDDTVKKDTKITHKETVPISNDVSESDESNSDSSDNENKEKHQIKKENIGNFSSDSVPKSKESLAVTLKDSDKSGTDELENSMDIFETIDESDIDKISSCKDFIKEHFLVNMPTNFFNFWDFCKKLKSTNPQEALKDIGLILVGPFDVLAGKFDNITKTRSQYLIHWRYFRDPPEFQTVLRGDDKFGYHIGYFRDSPDETPVFLCSNQSKKDGILTAMGGNIFAAVNFYLEDLKKSGDPFKKMHIGRIQTALKKEADILRMDMSRKTDKMVEREKKIVTRSFNKIGLVVPFDKKSEVGYRELALNNKDLDTLLTKLQNAKSQEDKSQYLSQLQPVFTFANIATDECDFGTGIELGWNLLAHGIDSLNSTIRDFLVTNYQLLNRETFGKIATAHMENRRQDCNLSIL